MMSTAKPQAISGVSANTENVITSVWPSIAANGLGQMIGGLYQGVANATTFKGVPLGLFLIVPLTAPLAAVLFILTKGFGNRYVLTNRHVQIWNSLGTTRGQEVALSEIAAVTREREDDYAWFSAADIVLVGASGQELLRMEAVSNPDVFQQSILKAKQARISVDASLKQIQNR